MEKSYIWTCNEFGDGGPNSFSLEVVFTWLGTILTSYSPEAAGVIPWKSTNTEIFELLDLGEVAPTGELKPTYDSGVLSVDTGLGITGGIFYVNTAAKTFNIAALKSGYASATDRIVLRREVLSQTARLVYIQATATSTTAPLVQNKVYWDIPIARINLDGSGDYASFIDDRKYPVSPMAGKLLLDQRVIASGTRSADTYTFTIPAGYSSLELHFSGSLTAIASNTVVRFNNDLGDYRRIGSRSDGTTVSGSLKTGTAVLFPRLSALNPYSIKQTIEMTIPNYGYTDVKSGFYKAYVFEETLNSVPEFDSGVWFYDETAASATPAPISRIDVIFTGSVTFGSNCVLSLYGIK